MLLEAFGKSDRGCTRPENEDRILCDAALSLFVVCDGMGGPQRGGVAADLAVAAIRYYVDTTRDRCDVSWPFGYSFALSVDANRLATSVRLANRQVWRRAEQSLECAGMGATVAAVLFGEERMVMVNIGDSRIYRCRQGHLEQVSVDDTIIATMLQKGLLSREEAATHPMRNVVTQAVGSHEDVEIHLVEDDIVSGDTILLCSDGLYNVVPEAGIQAALESGATAEACVEQFVAAAKAAGGPDNVSAVVLRCG
ncbi:MAG: protein phosphatase 2C domain-containing protein [Bryobacteraceae bacterium]|nr:protein phosphatase 2C domain-containing protein [Bryobacteraceae bacterium]